jgi:regulator of sirC expression with transglutaminase-like and TPR domain
MSALDRTTFAAEVEATGADLDPVRANLLFAREIAYPHLRPTDCLLQLDDLWVAAQPAVGSGGAVFTRGRSLAEFLFHRQGFRGDHESFTDPRNSYLSDVVSRRLGLPISLSVVYMYVARGLGLPVFGVGLPGHFIIGLAADGERLFMDPFNGGAVVDEADCLRLVAQSSGYRGAFNPRWLAPTPSREIVARMLANLRNSYTMAEEWQGATRVLERLRELQPEQATHLRDLGMLHYKAGAYNQAVRFFGEYLALAPGAADAADIRQSQHLLIDELARLN